MKIFGNVFYYLTILLVVIPNIFNSVKAQTNPTDSLLVLIEKANEATIAVYSFYEKEKKIRGKILIQNNSKKIKYTLQALTPIDEVIKLHYGKDNRLREFCSVVYRYGTGYYFVSASTNIQGQWESNSVSFMRFIELDELHQIKKITFAHHQPKVFKVEFVNPKTQQKTYAEINGKIEQIDCHTCFYKD